MSPTIPTPAGIHSGRHRLPHPRGLDEGTIAHQAVVEVMGHRGCDFTEEYYFSFLPADRPGPEVLAELGKAACLSAGPCDWIVARVDPERSRRWIYAAGHWWELA